MCEDLPSEIAQLVKHFGLQGRGPTFNSLLPQTPFEMSDPECACCISGRNGGEYLGSLASWFSPINEIQASERPCLKGGE